MAVIETWLEQDLQKPVQVKHLDGNLFSHNGNGNRIGVRVYNNGEPVTLSGTVSGYVVTADGSTVPCTGARSGNSASILIPAAAYQPGAVFVTVFLTDGSTVTTLASVATNVLQARTNNQVSPGSVVTDWTNTINAAMQAVETAAANLGSIVATPYASLLYPVPLGKYTYYNGNLYRCTTPITTSESFTASHWSPPINLGDDVSALKITALCLDDSIKELALNNVLKQYTDCDWVRKRAVVTESILYEQASTTFCHSAFLSPGGNRTITIASGYKAIVYEGAYNEFGHEVNLASGGWKEGSIAYTYHPAVPYIIIGVMKDGSPTPEITPIEAYNAIRVYSQTPTVLALNSDMQQAISDINDLYTKVHNGVVYFKDTNDVAIGRELPVLTTEYTVAQGKKLLADGTVIDNQYYNIITLPVTERYVYRINVNPGNDYAIIRTMQLEDANGVVLAYHVSPGSGQDIKYVCGVSGVCKLCYRNAYNFNLKKYETTLSSLSKKADLFIGEERTISPTYTEHKYISAENGRVLDTSGNFSVTNDIEVNAGDVIYVPSTTVSDVASLVSKRLPNPTPLYEPLVTLAETNLEEYYYVVKENCNVAFCSNTNEITLFKVYRSPIEDVYGKIDTLSEDVQDLSESISEINPIVRIPTRGQILYEADTRATANSGHICNAVMYDDGVIIAARSNGTVVRIGYDGSEEVLLSLQGQRFEWRGLYMDSNENVYASPHASWGEMNVADRGLYRLVKGASSMTKVISLYNPNSSVPSETEDNNDTIWTMCEDKSGNLYAGVYAHTVRANPAIYKSIDGGVTWSYIFNFNTAGLTSGGMHIHTIIYSKWKNALYCIVGEINTVFKSVDGGTTWTDLHVVLTIKGSSMLATQFGILIGSDGAYNCDIDLLYPDDTTHKKVFRGWANTVFAIRISDLTGFIYAFTKIDSSVNSTSYFPPVTVLDGTTTIEEWRATVTEGQYLNWKNYHDSVVDDYPTDAIRPQHYSILISRDGGESWEPLKRFSCLSTGANGLWTTGYFKNGECLTGRMERNGGTITIMNPVVISEGKHRYVSGGCDLSGEILVRTNTSQTVPVI